MSTQTKWVSLLEAKVNALIGIVVSWSFTYWLFPPLFGVTLDTRQATGITLCYFFMSTARAFAIRRVFNNWR